MENINNYIFNYTAETEFFWKEGAVDCGYGDAAIVADRESNEILVTLV